MTPPAKLARLDVPELAGRLARGVAEFYSAPEHQAFLAGAFVTAGLTRKMRPLPGMICAFIGGLAAEKAYLMMRDVRDGTAAIEALGQALRDTIDLIGGQAGGGPDPAEP